MSRIDVTIVGGGIIGLATAYRLLQQQPDWTVVVLEKEDDIAQHQTGRNSGVIHSGIYYKPGSLKATNCRAGKDALEAFCDQEDIPYETCGKVIVATDASEVPALHDIFERGQANGVDCEMIGPDRLRSIEPYVAGVRAIHVPETGIVDYSVVARHLANRVRAMGGTIRTGACVQQIIPSNGATRVYTSGGDVTTRFVVNCAGLHSDRVAALSGTAPDVHIVPFRGEYYRLTPAARRFCRGLIYPVPNPNFPFLGVHFTRRINGEVDCGPNAVLAFAREGYTATDINPTDLAETLTDPGFLKLAARYWQTGLAEMWRSFRKQAFVRALQTLVPDVRSEHLEPAPAGVRAQAVTPNGELLDDFKIETTGPVINVCNAPSPAATSSLNIGQTIARRLIDRTPLSKSPSTASPDLRA